MTCGKNRSEVEEQEDTSIAYIPSLDSNAESDSPMLVSRSPDVDIIKSELLDRATSVIQVHIHDHLQNRIQELEEQLDR